MNKSESKYFATAARMDEAFLALLEKKDFAYITVKEICEAASVNRSTFYLHYETMADLLSESVSHMNEQFLAYMKKDSEAFVTKLRDCPLDELYLITPEYLTPYLGYVKENQRLFRTALEKGCNSAVGGQLHGAFSSCHCAHSRPLRHTTAGQALYYGVLYSRVNGNYFGMAKE